MSDDSGRLRLVSSVGSGPDSTHVALHTGSWWSKHSFETECRAKHGWGLHSAVPRNLWT